MKKGTFEQTGSHDRRTFGRIYIALALVLVLLVGGVIGGTLAWLTAQSEPVNNVFTPSNIDVTLEESTGKEYKMVPGHTIYKNPVVTVSEGSEPCWLFVKIEESNNRDNNLEPIYIEYQVLMEFDEWRQGNGTDIPANVYYREVGTEDMGTPFHILVGDSYEDPETQIEYTWGDDHVLVLPTVTKEMMAAIENNTALQPTLTFTAYAVQLFSTTPTNPNDLNDAAAFTAAQAWDIAKNMSPTN